MKGKCVGVLENPKLEARKGQVASRVFGRALCVTINHVALGGLQWACLIMFSNSDCRGA